MYSRGDRSSSSCSVRCYNLKDDGNVEEVSGGHSGTQTRLTECRRATKPVLYLMISADLDVRMFADHAVTGQELQVHTNKKTRVKLPCTPCVDAQCSRPLAWSSYLSHQKLQQRGLPCSIGAHQSHACIQVDTKLQVFINVRLEGDATRPRVRHRGASS